jgi:hypothetical protein
MAIVIPLCVTYAIYCLLTMPAGPVTTPDSAHYLSFSPIVPLGYPLFLSMTGGRGAMVAQPMIFAAALAFLGGETRRATGRTWVAAALVAACIAVPQVRAFHASILTESLFMSTLAIVLALLMRFSDRPSWHLMVPIAVAVGVSATLRRTGYAFFVILALAAWMQRSRLAGAKAALFLVAAVAPFTFVMAGEQVAASVIHRGQTSGLLGRHIFAKAALLDAPPAPAAAGDPSRAILDQHLEARYAPVRQLLAAAPADVRGVLTIYYETCLQGACADGSRRVLGDSPEPEQAQAMGRAGAARIIRAPLAYARLTARHYASLWTFDRLRHPRTAPALAAFVASRRPLPFEHEAFGVEAGEAMTFPLASPHVRYAQPAFFVLGFFTAALALAGVVGAAANRRLPPLPIAACLAALTAHAALLLTAGLAAGFSRFLIGVWPAIATAAVLGGWAIVQALAPRGGPLFAPLDDSRLRPSGARTVKPPAPGGAAPLPRS